jgi:citrate lyase subunit alpha/citrate CoA-transferase
MPDFEFNDIPYIDKISAVHGPFDPLGKKLVKDTRTLLDKQRERNKVLPSLEAAIEAVGLRDGMTISFHHHFRNGDYVVNMVMEAIAKMGFRDLTVAASSLNEIHEPLINHIRNGVVTHIETSGMRGKLADAISDGLMDFPVIFRSHGGRAAAIETGELHIDVAFLGAPTSDPYGNANGYSRESEDGGTSCGSMGYAKIDAMHADKCVIITDSIVPFPNAPFGIPESQVDCVVKVDKIGDPNKIMSGATRFTTNPKELLIAQTAAFAIENSGYFYDGFSMQMGSGGASLAVARFIREKMLEKNIKARFALGGITGQIVEMHEEGLIHRILDVQSFDLIAAKSLKNNRFHQQIDASYYASYLNEGAAVNQLDFTVLSAMEIDVDFNVNVLTGSNGVIRGAIGGHPDSAAGASMTVVVTPLMRGRIPCVLGRVNTIVTPGRSVDVVVTDQGTAVNPSRPDLLERFQKAGGIELCTMEELRDRAERICGRPTPNNYADRVVGLSLYRDNTVIDIIRQVKN